MGGSGSEKVILLWFLFCTHQSLDASLSSLSSRSTEIKDQKEEEEVEKLSRAFIQEERVETTAGSWGNIILKRGHTPRLGELILHSFESCPLKTTVDGYRGKDGGLTGSC